MLGIETVAVLGQGEAATGCAILAALAGCAVRFHQPDAEALERAFQAVRFRVDVTIERGMLTRSDRQQILDGILFSSELEETATGADLVAALEDQPSGAAAALGRVVGLVRATAALAAPSLEAAIALAATVPQPGRVLALEVDRRAGTIIRVTALATPLTSQHTLSVVQAFAARVSARGRHEA
jgi:3-hydroxybutyryl-CoA dehydrogenase